MPPLPNPPAEDSKSVVWLLQSFTISKEQKTTSPAFLFLEHGQWLVHQQSPAGVQRAARAQDGVHGKEHVVRTLILTN